MSIIYSKNDPDCQEPNELKSKHNADNKDGSTVSILLLIQNSVLDKRLSSFSRDVLIRLLTHFNHKTELCNPSEETLAEALDVSERSVWSAIKQLKDTEWIYVKRRHRNDSYHYSFNWTKAVKIDLKTKHSEPQESAVQNDTPNRKITSSRTAKSRNLEPQRRVIPNRKNLRLNLLNEPIERNTQQSLCEKTTTTSKEEVTQSHMNSQDAAELFSSQSVDDSLSSVGFSSQDDMDSHAVGKLFWNALVDAQTAAEETASQSQLPHAAAKDSLLDSQAADQQTSAHSQTDDVSAFDRFWNTCSNQVAEEDARAAWNEQIKAGVDAEVMIAARRNYEEIVAGKAPRYVMEPANWLDEKRWKDVYRDPNVDQIQASKEDPIIEAMRQQSLAASDRHHQKMLGMM